MERVFGQKSTNGKQRRGCALGKPWAKQFRQRLRRYWAGGRFGLPPHRTRYHLGGNPGRRLMENHQRRYELDTPDRPPNFHGRFRDCVAPQRPQYAFHRNRRWGLQRYLFYGRAQIHRWRGYVYPNGLKLAAQPESRHSRHVDQPCKPRHLDRSGQQWHLPNDQWRYYMVAALQWLGQFQPRP